MPRSQTPGSAITGALVLRVRLGVLPRFFLSIADAGGGSSNWALEIHPSLGLKRWTATGTENAPRGTSLASRLEPQFPGFSAVVGFSRASGKCSSADVLNQLVRFSAEPRGPSTLALLSHPEPHPGSWVKGMKPAA